MTAPTITPHLCALAANTIDASGASWVHLLPAAGRIVARDGRQWVMSDPEGVVTASLARAGKMSIAVDYEHQAERAEANGQPAPAAGWITALDARPDGVWGLVEWTAKARDFIANREYRYLSPTFNYEKASGEVARLIGAALTNRPALELTALAKDQSMNPETEALSQLRAIFNLAADAAPDAIVEAARTSVASATAAADPSRFVPMEVFSKVTAELNKASRGVSAEAAAMAVDREISSGRLMPFMKDWAAALCAANKPAFDTFVEQTSGPLQVLFTPINRPALKPSPDPIDEEIARNLGLTA